MTRVDRVSWFMRLFECFVDLFSGLSGERDGKVGVVGVEGEFDSERFAGMNQLRGCK